MAGLFGSLGGGVDRLVGGVLSLPGNMVQGLNAGWQNYADAATTGPLERKLRIAQTLDAMDMQRRLRRFFGGPDGGPMPGAGQTPAVLPNPGQDISGAGFALPAPADQGAPPARRVPDIDTSQLEDAPPGTPKASAIDELFFQHNPVMSDPTRASGAAGPTEEEAQAILDAQRASGAPKRVPAVVADPAAASGPRTSPYRIPSLQEAAPLLAAASMTPGVKVDGVREILTALQPDLAVGPDGTVYNKKDATKDGTRLKVPTVVNGRLIDEGDPKNLDQYVPQLEPGEEALYDGAGRVVAVRNLAGKVQAIGEREGAKAQAEEQAKADLDMVEVPRRDGSKVMMPRARAVQMLNGAGYKDAASKLAAGATPGGDLGVAQSPGDTEYDKTAATSAAKRLDDYRTAAQSADSQIATMKQIGDLLTGYEGGKFSPLKTDIASAARSLGLKGIDANLPNKEAARALSQQFALMLRDPSAGGGMPGSLSNSDREYLNQMTPNLAQTSQGRATIINTQVALRQRKQEVAGFAEKWSSAFGGLHKRDSSGRSFDQYLAQWAEANPIFARK